MEHEILCFQFSIQQGFFLLTFLMSTGKTPVKADLGLDTMGGLLSEKQPTDNV